MDCDLSPKIALPLDRPMLSRGCQYLSLSFLSLFSLPLSLSILSLSHSLSFLSLSLSPSLILCLDTPVEVGRWPSHRTAAQYVMAVIWATWDLKCSLGSSLTSGLLVELNTHQLIGPGMSVIASVLLQCVTPVMILTTQCWLRSNPYADALPTGAAAHSRYALVCCSRGRGNVVTKPTQAREEGRLDTKDGGDLSEM